MRQSIALMAGVAILSLAASGQTAKVVALNGGDQMHVLVVKHRLEAAQKEWDDLKLDIEHRYISDSREEPDYGGSGVLTLGGSALSGPYLYVDAFGSVQSASSERLACYHWVDGKGTAEEEKLCKKVMAARAKSAEQMREEEEREKEAERQRIAKLPKRTVYQRKNGWQDGFDYSEMYEFIVPHLPVEDRACQPLPFNGFRNFNLNQ